MTSPRTVSLQPGYLLHQRDYRNTSRILDFLTQDYGRVTAVARGVRRGKSRLRGVLTQFVPLRISWVGLGDMVTLTGAEPGRIGQAPKGLGLLCGFYVNELLLKLLPSGDPTEGVFDNYTACLSWLQPDQEAKGLRVFEKRLLANLGYGLNLDHDFVTAQQVCAEGRYGFEPERGPYRVEDRAEEGYSGASLLSLAAEDLSDPQSLWDARLLLCETLDIHLGGKPLKSRAVLRAMRRSMA